MGSIVNPSTHMPGQGRTTVGIQKNRVRANIRYDLVCLVEVPKPCYPSDNAFGADIIWSTQAAGSIAEMVQSSALKLTRLLRPLLTVGIVITVLRIHIDHSHPLQGIHELAV